MRIKYQKSLIMKKLNSLMNNMTYFAGFGINRTDG